MKTRETIAIRDKRFLKLVTREARRRQQRRLTVVTQKLAEERLLELQLGQFIPPADAAPAEATAS